MHSKVLKILMCLFSFSSIAYGQDELSYSKDEWRVTCDNTRTCRVTGYESESDGDDGASIMLVIEPGEKSNIYGYVRTLQEHLKPPTLYINNQNLDSILASSTSDDEFELSNNQINRLLNPKEIISIELKSASSALLISPSGIAEVLAQVDEFQNRAETPLAITKKGEGPARQLKPYINPPVINKKPIDKNLKNTEAFAKNIDKLYPYLSEKFNETPSTDYSCNLSYAEDITYIKNSIQVHPLNEEAALISHPCWRAAYNSADMYWLVNKDFSHVQAIDGVYTSFDDGILELSIMRRATGDCFYFESRVWDGQTFQLSKKSETGMCKGAPGGFWDIPIFVSDVKTSEES